MMPQVNDFSCFSVFGKMRVWLTEIIASWSAPQLSRANILLFPILNPPRAHTERWLRADGPQYLWLPLIWQATFFHRQKLILPRVMSMVLAMRQVMKLPKEFGENSPSGKESTCREGGSFFCFTNDFKVVSHGGHKF